MEPKCTFTIGRSHDCDILLNDYSVSRLHAKLSLFQNGQWVLTDLGSRFGTFIRNNDQYVPISEERIFSSDTILRFATHTITVRELLEQACYTNFLPQSAHHRARSRLSDLWEFIVSTCLAHPAWAGIGAIAAVVALYFVGKQN